VFDEYNGKNPKLRTEDGMLTELAFACGYVDRFLKGDYDLEMFMRHEVYHVRMFYYTETACKFVFKTAFPNIHLARKCFLRAKLRMIKNGHFRVREQ
jgi:hypothetical protein